MIEKLLCALQIFLRRHSRTFAKKWPNLEINRGKLVSSQKLVLGLSDRSKKSGGREGGRGQSQKTQTLKTPFCDFGKGMGFFGLTKVL